MCLCYFRMVIRSVQLERGMKKNVKTYCTPRLGAGGRGPGHNRLTRTRMWAANRSILHILASPSTHRHRHPLSTSHTHWVAVQDQDSRVVSEKEYHGATSETYVCMYVYPLNFLEVLRCQCVIGRLGRRAADDG